MEELLAQIKFALKNNLYYLALYATLALPDICSALSSEDGQTSGRQYMDWYNKYAKNKCSSILDGYGCYKFRCSSLHQGTTQHKKMDYSRVLFLEPTNNAVVLHDNILNDALNIDLNIFCLSMIDAVINWQNDVKNDPIFIKNYKSFMKRYPNGLSPYIGGVPVIS